MITSEIATMGTFCQDKPATAADVPIVFGPIALSVLECPLARGVVGREGFMDLFGTMRR